MSTTKRQKQLTLDMQAGMDYDELINCMRCGFCLPSCPTYRETGNEAASPRGRIALMKAVVDGIMDPDDDFENQLSLCLGCRACEPACPSGVKYGHLLEDARAIIQKDKKHSTPVRLLRSLVFEGLFPNQNRMRSVSGLLWFYQKTGIQKVAQATSLTKIAPGNLSVIEKVLPNVPGPSRMKARPEHVAPASGTAKKKVAFFSGCLMDTMFMETNDATLFLLQKANCDTVIPKKQSCCGALHAHSGEQDGAKEMAKENIRIFEKENVDLIVSNAGGCGAMLVDYGHLLKNDPEWAERAKLFSSKVKDISEILLEVGLPKMKLDEQIVTYQDSCHLRNVMGTHSAPRKLLQSIEGVTYTEMKDADSCCGSAGVYNIIEEEMSMQILDVKMEHAKATKARTLVTANPGCLLQMKLGVERAGLQKDVKAIHIVDLLAEAVRNCEK